MHGNNAKPELFSIAKYHAHRVATDPNTVQITNLPFPEWWNI